MVRASKFILLLLMLSGGILLSACSSKEKDPEPEEEKPPVITPGNGSEWAEAADMAQDALRVQFYNGSKQSYNQNNSGHTGFNYWWHAHVLDVLVDGYLRTQDSKYLIRINELVEGMKKNNGKYNQPNALWNTFYDDMEWMGIASLRAYKATNNPSHLTNAKQLFEWIIVGWSDVKEGGIAWASGSPNSKNACSNAPAAILAARLYQLEKEPKYLEWAQKIYNWQRTHVVDPVSGAVWDAYGNTKLENVYSYNQGTWVGAALEMYNITKDEKYLRDAKKTSNYVINDVARFSPEGILREAGGGTGDGGLFKGIFIRYFSELTMHPDLDQQTRNTYVKYLKANGRSLLDKATKKPEFIFHPHWRSMPSSISNYDKSVHLSGMMLFESLDMLIRNKIIID